MAMQTVFRFMVPLLFLSMLSGCAVTNKFGPYIGKVVDAETKEPIEGAVVFMTCYTTTPTLAGVNSHYAGFKEAVTDGQGEFLLELRLSTLKPGHAWSYEPEVFVFKPGYGVYPWHKNAKSDTLARNTSHLLPANKFVTITLPKLKTKKERKRNLGFIMAPYLHKNEFSAYENLFRLRNFEYIKLGLKPYRLPPKNK